jgi:diguanylate cyclase (GGDEF)-like protein
MLLSRDELIATVFRETDRVQRMKMPLALILFGIDDWERWRARLGAQMVDEAEQVLVERMTRLLRCYDSMGRYGEGEFVLVLPGCSSFNAVSLAARLRQEVLGETLVIRNEEMRFTACFGVAGSGGRSALVVLRNCEQALEEARRRGPGSIERCTYDTEPDPAMFLTPVIEDEALHW